MIKLELTEQETQQIIQALAAQPFGQVYQLIPKIEQQANDSLLKEIKDAEL